MPSLASEVAAQATADLLDRHAEELYRRLLPHSRLLARGVLSTLLSAAEQLRGGFIMGANAVDVRYVVDIVIGGNVAVSFLQLHRGEPPLLLEGPPLRPGHLGELITALRGAERAGDDEVEAVLQALHPEVEAWLARAADEAKAGASAKELALWGDGPPLVVAVEMLVAVLRLLAREAVRG